MNISEMIKNRADLVGQMRNFVDTHEDKSGKLSAEDAAAYAKMETEFQQLSVPTSVRSPMSFLRAWMLTAATLFRLSMIAD